MAPAQQLIPVFIGGTGRTGTTILRQVLGTHHQIVAVATELRIIADPDGLLDLFLSLTERWSPYTADAAIHRFLTLRDCKTITD